MPNLQAIAIGIVISLLAGFGAGWTVQGWRKNTQIESLKTASATLQSTINQNAVEYIAKIREKDLERSKVVNAIAQSLSEANAKNAQLENDRSARIASGAERVYVRANCPSSHGVPTDSTSAPRIDETGPELDPAYRQTLSDLRREARNSAEQITHLQDYAKSCSTKL